MKNIIELSLVAVLVAVLSLNAKMSGINSLLGKAILIASVICMSHKFGTNAGLLSAAIAIVLLNKNLREGMEDKKDDKKHDEKKKDDEKDDDDKPDLEKVEASNSDKKDDEKKKDNEEEDDEKKKDNEEEDDKKEDDDKDDKKDKDGSTSGTETENFIGSMTKRLVGGIIHSADEFLNLPQTLVAYRTNDDIMTGMRRMEQAKQAPGGCALYTKHTDTMKIVNGTN